MTTDAEYKKYVKLVDENLKTIYGAIDISEHAELLIARYGPEIAYKITYEAISDDTEFWRFYDENVHNDHPAGDKTPSKPNERIDLIINKVYSWKSLADYIDMSEESFEKKVFAGRDYSDRVKAANSKNKMDTKVKAATSQKKMEARVNAKAPTFKANNLDKKLASECMKVLEAVENSDSRLYICMAGNLTCIGTTFQYCKEQYKVAGFSDTEYNLLCVANDVGLKGKDNLQFSRDGGKTWENTKRSTTRIRNKKNVPVYNKWTILQDAEYFPKGGQEFMVKVKTDDGKVHTMKMRRITDAGFELLEVDGKKAPTVSKEQGKAINFAVLDSKYSEVKKEMAAVWDGIDVATRAWALYLHFTKPGLFGEFIDELKKVYPNKITKSKAASTTSKKGGKATVSYDDGVDKILGKYLTYRSTNTGRVFQANKDGFGR